MIDPLVDSLIYGLAGLSESTHLGKAAHFFVYEVIVIGFLLLAVTHLIGLVNAYFPVGRVRDLIASGRLGGSEHVVASLFGAVTPFCSCSSVPLFIGFLQGGIPLGVTLSFLITSPLVNEVALALFIGLFGWQVTAIYAASGIGLGALLGWGLGLLGLENYLRDWVREVAQKGIENSEAGEQAKDGPLSQRLATVSQKALEVTAGVVPYLLAGLAVGAAVHGFVPTSFFESYMSEDNLYAVPLSVAAAVPMYAGASGVVPIVESLVSKGVPLGTAIAFMMAVVGLSLPEALMLKKVMRARLLGAFFGAVGASMVALGYLFNWIL